MAWVAVDYIGEWIFNSKLICGLVIVSNIIIGCHKIYVELMVFNFHKVALRNSSEWNCLFPMIQSNLNKNSYDKTLQN